MKKENKISLERVISSAAIGATAGILASLADSPTALPISSGVAAYLAGRSNHKKGTTLAEDSVNIVIASTYAALSYMLSKSLKRYFIE